MAVFAQIFPAQHQLAHSLLCGHARLPYLKTPHTRETLPLSHCKASAEPPASAALTSLSTNSAHLPPRVVSALDTKAGRTLPAHLPAASRSSGETPPTSPAGW